VPGSPRKKFGLITAVHNVARFLPDFIASIEAQTYPLADVVVVAVDDGSSDDSLEVLEQWSASRPDLVTVLTKQNGGQGSARNAGLDIIDCEWVSFPDPDDAFDPAYLARVAAVIDSHPDLAMVATNRLIWRDGTGEPVNGHPLRSMFEHDQVKNQDGYPEYFHGSAPAAFMRMAVIEADAIRFDERIRPNFEDGHFCQRYLLRAGAPEVAFLKSAVYLYRKRADQSSTLQTGHLIPSRFTVVPRLGFLALLREAAELRGAVPEWLQNMIIYELSYYISPEDDASAATACHGEVANEFIETMTKIRTLLDDDVIRSFNTRVLRAHWRQVLLYAFRSEPWHTPYVVMHRYDSVKRQVLISYRFTGPEPVFEPQLRGKPVAPVATKIRDFRYWDHAVMHERLAWVPARGTVRVRLGQRYVELRTNWSDFTPTYVRPSAIRRRLGVSTGTRSSRKQRLAAAQRSARRDVTRAASRYGPARREFRGAWVFMDRIDDAGDNAQRLFEYVRANRSDINAWFVLDPESPDWARLRRSTNRLIAHGSLRWKLLMLNCRYLISSHADVGIVRPPGILQLEPRPHWRFVFLQHGVIKDDISSWLNLKVIDLFVTSTPPEHHSIVGSGTGYQFTTKEVKMTGLARFDRLRRIASGVAESEQRTVLVAPTWRNYLNIRLASGEHRRRVVPNFLDTEYARNWLGLLSSPELAKACAAANLRIGFLPHPNIQPVLAELALPGHVDALRYADHDVQELFAKAAVLITDYSSVAFNAAYIDRPVVYFQFDRKLIAAGGHLGRQGYFDYESDGFGPVASTLEQAVDETVRTIGAGRRTQSPYAERIAATFPERDGRCCQRTVEAIEALGKP
jgi:glycosyltransferase involved in cell wall biosynthesis/CDP-glycerol glycerophosphotransferase (TagB/SpsB family)